MISVARATCLLRATALILLIPGEAATVLADAEGEAAAMPRQQRPSPSARTRR